MRTISEFQYCRQSAIQVENKIFIKIFTVILLKKLEMSAALRAVYYYPQALFPSLSLSHSLCRTIVIMREASHEFSYLGFLE